MAYDPELAERIRTTLARRRGVSERKMFGGICFMVNGNMCCGVVRSDLMLRLGDEGAEAALDAEHTRPMDFTGKPMRSMVYVDAAGIETDEDLKSWVERAFDFARSLPPKA
jgi:TfoX/Sxy family transcriptional regulator of competence genes